MRVIIKNADFSEVSIGKVVKDLSFSYVGEALNNIFANPVDDWSLVIDALPYDYSAGQGHNEKATLYVGGSDAQSWTVLNNANRFVTEEIEVCEGMQLTVHLNSTFPTNMPSITCFDSDHQVLAPNVAASWTSPYTIPAGVKYVKFQFQGISTTTSVAGTMPE